MADTVGTIVLGRKEDAKRVACGTSRFDLQERRCARVWELSAISLLNFSYKVNAKLLLDRLKRAGAESRLWSSQYGFRSKKSTTHALALLHRKIEEAWSLRCGRLLVLALDWQKAFDRIPTSALLSALKRFGLPSQFVDAVRDIYTDRSFCVSDCGVTSAAFPQETGIGGWGVLNREIVSFRSCVRTRGLVA